MWTKRLCISISILLLCVSTAYANSAQSQNYRISVSTMDSGGAKANSASFKMMAQSSGQTAIGTNTSATYKGIHGLHFSSEIATIAGYTPYDRLTLALTAQAHPGSMTNRIQFAADINSIETPLTPIDIDLTDGWSVNWNTLINVPVTASVVLKARGYDGLSWGKWYTTNPIIVDNDPPDSPSINLIASGGALNSETGALDAAWTHQATDIDYYEVSWIEVSEQELGEDADNIWSPLENSIASNWNTFVDDASGYQIKVLSTDLAGNASPLGLSNIAYTPDRTAPQIAEFPLSVNGNESIIGTEDVNITNYNISSHKYDKIDSGSNLSWSIQTLTQESDDLLTTIAVVNDNIAYELANDYNTDDNHLTNGNLYGLNDNAQVELTLTDSEGNYSAKNLWVYIEPVNDPPVWNSDIIGSVWEKTGGNYIYNTKFDEDTTNEIELDPFVLDIDNLKSALTWWVSGNVKVGSSIGDPSTNHLLTLSPDTDWYGDEALTVNVTDNDYDETNPDSYIFQKITARVWPVNDPPTISELPAFYSNEDTALTADLSAYENDKEDIPSHLTWSIDPASFSGQVTVIQTTGEKSADDELVFTPQENDYGTTNVTVSLTDSDQKPKTVFSNYTPTPMTVTSDMTIVWRPINDAPSIQGTIAAQVKNEDTGSWTIDLSSYESDIEDTGQDEKLNWSVDIDPAIASSAMDNATNILTLTPVQNAWGTANIAITLTDTDDAINFTPYSPQPTSSVQIVSLQLNEQNDIPESLITMFGSDGQETAIPERAKTTDVITATAFFTDIGYNAGARNSSQTGDEYGRESIPELNYTQNTKLYNYKWYVDDELVSAATSLNDPNDSNTFSVTESLEGKVIKVEVFPNDGLIDGAVQSQSMRINHRPIVTTPISPAYDEWINQIPFTMNWNTTTDEDADDIYYRVVAWKMTNRFISTPNVDLETIDYDSGWLKDTTATAISYSNGHYYWMVLTGNKFSANSFDYIIPSMMGKFHIDTEITEEPPDRLVGNPGDDGGSEFSKENRVIYGEKGATTSVWIDVVEEDLHGNIYADEFWIVTHNLDVEDDTATENWQYIMHIPLVLNEPDAILVAATYNVYIKDAAQNKSYIYTPLIYERDMTPPAIPILTGTDWLSTANHTYQAITSQNNFVVTGTKESGATIWWQHADSTRISELFGEADSTEFSVTINAELLEQNNAIDSWRSAELVAFDTRGNRSTPTVNVDIMFLLGTPEIQLLSQERDSVNLAANLPESDIELSSSQISWKADRVIKNYQLLREDDEVIASGNSESADVTINCTISTESLEEGKNTLYLKIKDLASNIGTLAFVMNRLSTPPTINLENGSLFLHNASLSFRVQDPLRQVTFSISTDKINFVAPTAVTTSNYQNHQFVVTHTDLTFDFNSTEFYIKVIDQVLNEYIATINNSTIGIASIFDPNNIIFEVTHLPQDIFGLYSLHIQENEYKTTSFIQPSVQESIFNGLTESDKIHMTPVTKKSVYMIYVKNWDQNILTHASLENAEIKLGIPYEDTPKIEPDKLIPVYFNVDDQIWTNPELPVEIDLENRRVITEIQKIGIYGLAEFKPFSETLSEVRIYPNPWVPNDNDELTGDSSGITFDHLMETENRIRIYTLTGQLIVDEIATNSTWTWDGTNRDGNDVFSGVYLYLITNQSEIKKGKITIVR